MKSEHFILVKLTIICTRSWIKEYTIKYDRIIYLFYEYEILKESL
jgi:hypothetical protein